MDTRRATVVLLLLLGTLLGGCTSTTITSVWRADDFAGPPLQSILVVARTGQEYHRQAWEQEAVARFRKRGLVAFAASTVLPQATKPEINLLAHRASEQGVEALLLLRYTGTRTVEQHHPPEIEYYSPWWDYYSFRHEYYSRHPGIYRRPSPFHWPYHPFYRYYYPWREVTVVPGYTTLHKVVLVESSLLLAGSGKKVWGMTTETRDPGSGNRLIAELCSRILEQLRQQGLTTSK